MLKDLIISRPDPSTKCGFFTNGPMKTSFKIFTKCVQDLCIRACKDQGVSEHPCCPCLSRQGVCSCWWDLSCCLHLKNKGSLQHPDPKPLCWQNSEFCVYTKSMQTIRGCFRNVKVWCIFSLSYGFWVLTGNYCCVFHFFLCNCGG